MWGHTFLVDRAFISSLCFCFHFTLKVNSIFAAKQQHKRITPQKSCTDTCRGLEIFLQGEGLGLFGNPLKRLYGHNLTLNFELSKCNSSFPEPKMRQPTYGMMANHRKYSKMSHRSDDFHIALWAVCALLLIFAKTIDIIRAD